MRCHYPVRLVLIFACLFCFSSAAHAAQPPPYLPGPETLIIHAGTLLDVPGNPARARQSVIVKAGKVDSIRPGFVEKSVVEGDDNNEIIIDLREQFVMPGFIDLHVHISKEYGPNAKLETVTMDDADNALIAAMYARRTLNTGFTTLRDLGSRGRAVFALRDAIKAGKVPGPRLLVAGEALSATGGHGDIHGFRQEILDALAATATCDGPDSCRAAVRRQVKRGADVIKVTATGGVLSETAAGTGQQLTDAELRAIVETAHSLGRKVTAHAHAKEGIEAALRAGVDSVEHAMWADAQTMALFVETGAWMIPTIYPITAVGDTPEKMKQGPFGHLPAPIMEKLLQLGRQPKDMGALAYKMGVKIALGTDSGVSPHGENANEFIEYVNIGMSNMEALVAGTINAAIAAGIVHKTGSLETGKAADIVAMPGNPLDDIKAVLEVGFVMRDGIIFKHR
ncbi:MAG: amidohydrolase family protein [Gammaproteobacteria bacterium]|nr:amidohydrolase family protein [Gammaproteobacteria bacterium]MCY4339057.1 amidohydrolase family protein [Gammaproteobacteria bacterium]